MVDVAGTMNVHDLITSKVNIFSSNGSLVQAPIVYQFMIQFN